MLRHRRVILIIIHAALQLQALASDIAAQDAALKDKHASIQTRSGASAHHEDTGEYIANHVHDTYDAATFHKSPAWTWLSGRLGHPDHAPQRLLLADQQPEAHDKTHRRKRRGSHDDTGLESTDPDSPEAQAQLRKAAKNITELVKLWFHHNLTIAKTWPTFKKQCAPGCSKRGNCNHETGICECPYGRMGHECEKVILPACRMEDSEDAVIFSCREGGMRSCECHAQCKAFLHGLLTRKGEEMASEYHPRHLTTCWHWPGRPKAQQLSDVPAENDTSVVYWRMPSRWNGTATDRGTWPREMVPELNGTNGYPLLPVSRCPSKCLLRGRCAHVKNHDDIWVARCLCFPGYTGVRCDEVPYTPRVFEACLHNCNGRGSCVHGFCHCQPGYWGLDCSRSKAYGPAKGLSPVRDRPRVYIYDLPSWIAHRAGFEYAEIYKAHIWFLSLLAQDWAVRTENPWEANLFFLPTFNNHNGGNVGWQFGSAGHVRQAVRYVNQTLPFWRRHDGKDHFYWVTNDWGTCRYPQAWPEVQNPIRITHFGYHIKGPVANEWFKEHWDCFDVHKDIVAAPHDSGNLPVPGAHWPSPLGDFLRNKTYLMMYSGWVDKDGSQIQDYYSFGMRQELSRVFVNSSDPGVVFTTHLKTAYQDTLRKSVFCLNPVGFGWAIRAVAGAVHGCIPVTLQDGVYQVYEDLLPWATFSLRFSQQDVPSLLQQLQQVEPQQMVAMYRALRRWHKAFLWPPDRGGRAYDYTLASLYSRLHRMWGVIY